MFGASVVGTGFDFQRHFGTRLRKTGIQQSPLVLQRVDLVSFLKKVSEIRVEKERVFRQENEYVFNELSPKIEDEYVFSKAGNVEG